jgi:predicted Zn-dependent protease
MKRHFLRSLNAAGLLLLAACTTNPVTGKKQVSLMSEGQELAIGQQSDPQVIAQFGLVDNPALQRFIQDKGQQMAAISHRSNIKYEFKVVDSPVINAFAVPGGYVYFTRGIMAHFNNEAQFAGVLGHEIGHITARHSAQQQTKATLGQIALIGGMIASPQLAQYGEQAMQGLQVLFLKFGRDDERESDRLGVEYSTKIGYDAKQMADFFLTLQREQEKAAAASGAEAIPDFLSSHPNPGDRYNTVQQLAAEMQQQTKATNLTVGRDSYLRMIEGLIYGEDPKQGFVENSNFYHPELKFQFPVPAGWKHQNSPQQFQMAAPDGRAMMLLTLAPGESLEAAAQQMVQQFKLQPVESKQVTVNSFPALAIVADQQQQQQQGQPQQQQQAPGVRMLIYLIQDGKTIYAMIGASSGPDFATYFPTFSSSMQNFRRLTDADKLNRQPERVRIKSVPSATTLSQALTRFQVPNDRLEEMAILNGMQLTDRLTAGMLVKVVAK